jgi:hypothetical protein
LKGAIKLEKKRSPTEEMISLLIAAVIIGLVFGLYFGIQAYRDYLVRTSYVTRAWSYRDSYNMGYVAHAERTSSTEMQTADIYSAVTHMGLPKGNGVYIHVISEHFDCTTDCGPVIYSGKDGYEETDFAYDHYRDKYSSKRQRAYHMTELPFHFQLNLIPSSDLTAHVEGSVRISVIIFGTDEDPAKKNQAELDDWIEWALVAYTPDTIEIPYYYDGEYIYWSSIVIEELKG